MRNNSLKAAFQYKRIDLSNVNKFDSKKAENMGATLKQIWNYLKMEKGKLFLVILMVFISSIFALLGPFLVGVSIDNFIAVQQLNGLGLLLVGLVIVYIIHSLSLFLQNYWMVDISQQTVYTLRKNLFEQFHRLPISYFDKRQHGELMSRLTNDIDNINNTLNQSVIQIFASILTLLGTVSIMLYLSPVLTLVTMSIIPVMFFSMRWITRRTGPLYKLQQRDLVM